MCAVETQSFALLFCWHQKLTEHRIVNKVFCEDRIRVSGERGIGVNVCGVGNIGGVLASGHCYLPHMMNV